MIKDKIIQSKEILNILFKNEADNAYRYSRCPISVYQT